MLDFRSADPDRHVIVTGIGAVTPFGSADETWTALLRGDRAGRELTREEISGYDELRRIDGLRLHAATVDHARFRRIAEEVTGLRDVDATVADAWLTEPMIVMAIAALRDALDDAGLSFSDLNSDRTAVVFGSSKGGMRTADSVLDAVLNDADAADRRLREHAFPTNAASQAIAKLIDARGDVICPVAACATGLVAVLMGAMRIQSGDCDVCIVGSSDAALTASVLGSFHRLKVTSRHPVAREACRPFDARRDGFIVGEGAGVMILESRSHALQRGRQPETLLSGGGWLTDPTGITQVDESGAVVADLLRRVVRDPATIDAACLHGTGTVMNDLAEARGVAAVFPPHSLPCFGIKGAIGHLLGAAGIVEAAMAVKGVSARAIPGTANLETPDERCAIQLRSASVTLPNLRQLLKLSLGFGGHVAAAIFTSDRS